MGKLRSSPKAESAIESAGHGRQPTANDVTERWAPHRRSDQSTARYRWLTDESTWSSLKPSPDNDLPECTLSGTQRHSNWGGGGGGPGAILSRRVILSLIKSPVGSFFFFQSRARRGLKNFSAADGRRLAGPNNPNIGMYHITPRILVPNADGGSWITFLSLKKIAPVVRR